MYIRTYTKVVRHILGYYVPVRRPFKAGQKQIKPLLVTGYFRRENKADTANKNPKFCHSPFSRTEISRRKNADNPHPMTGIPFHCLMLQYVVTCWLLVPYKIHCFFIKSAVSPSQNNIGFSISQIWVYPQCLLRISAGLISPGIWWNWTTLEAIASPVSYTHLTLPTKRIV